MTDTNRTAGKPARRVDTRAGLPSTNVLCKRFAEYITWYGSDARSALERYSSTSSASTDAPRSGGPDWQDPAVRSALLRRGLALLQSAQIEAFRSGNIPDAAWTAFAYGYSETDIDYFVHEDFGRRFPGRKLRQLSLQADVCWLALGYSLGCTRAERLGGLIIRGILEQNFFDVEDYPILRFTVRLFADHTNLSLPSWFLALPENEHLEGLLIHWRATDAETIEKLIVRACELHELHCRAPRKHPLDFSTGIGTVFQRFPIEILMLFRLRESLGLANPVVDHPLMQGPLGVLPEPRACAPDDLLEAFLRQARTQGYTG